MVKNGKLFGKINIFDCMILVLLLLLILGFFAYLGIGAIRDNSLLQESALWEAEYKITLESVRSETVDSFKLGTAVYEADKKTQIGVISNIESEQAHVVMETFDGKAVKAPVEGKYDLTLTIRGVVRKSADGDLWLTTTERLLEGRNLMFLTQINKCQGMVKDIEMTESLGELNIKFSVAAENYYNEKKNENKE